MSISINSSASLTSTVFQLCTGQQ